MIRIDVLFPISVKLKVNFYIQHSHSLFLQEHKLISDGVTK